MTVNKTTLQENTTLFFSVFIVGLCTIIYELLIGSVSSYLLGDSIKQFALTRVALGAFTKLFLLCDTELLFQVLIPVIQFLELLLQFSDAALIIFFVHKTIIAD